MEKKMLTWYLDGKRLSKAECLEKNKKIILFGADVERNKQLFREVDKEDILYIFDNDEKKWGMYQEGIPIVEPFKANEDVVLISGIHDWKSISSQIEHMGYQKIYFFLTERVENIVGKYVSKFSPHIFNNSICQDMEFKYVHFIPDEKFFAPVIEYIEYGLNVKEHFFVIYGANSGNCNDVYGIWDKYRELSNKFHNIYLYYDEVYRLNLYDWTDNEKRLEVLIERAEKIILHCEILVKGVFDFFSDKINLIKKKGVFIPWGGNIGRNQYANYVIENILQYARMIPYSFPIDKEVMIKYFPLTENAIWLKTGLSYARLTEYIPRKKEKTKNILIAHSSHEYTKALETLQYLADVKQSVKIYCVTSYGPREIVKEIKYYGKKYFGESFHTVDKYLNYSEYVSFLSTMDIAVFGMEFLSGRDTIEILFWLGKKVYMKPDFEACKRMEIAGYKVHNYYEAREEIQNGMFDNPEEERNHLVAENEFNSEIKLKQWKELYEYKFED